MNVISTTTTHLFDIGFMIADERMAFDLKPSRNGWYSAVVSWMDEDSGRYESNSFMRVLSARVRRLHSGFNLSVHEGPTYELKSGVSVTETSLVGRHDGVWQTFGTVLLAVGEESLIDQWEQSEKSEWFDR